MQRSLKRVRIAFLAIGAALLCALGLFVRSTLSRLEHQRRLRHEVVAERIFDELERELTAYLAAETARPSSAYDATSSDPAAWAPFVVGYFTVASGYRVVGREQLEGSRVARVEQSLSALWPAPSLPASEGEPSSEIVLHDSKVSPAQTKPRSVQQPSSGSDVLKLLNRAGEERSRQVAPRPVQRPSSEEDPFGY